MMIKNNVLYDMLKQATQIWIPAFATLYFALSQIWGLPAGAEVVGTLTAVDAFLGVVLGISTKVYNESEARFDGRVNVIETEDVKTYQLQVNGDPNDIDKKDELILKVESGPTTTVEGVAEKS